MLAHYGSHVGVKVARKHLGWYTKGLTGSAEVRSLVNKITGPDEVKAVLTDFFLSPAHRQAA